MRKVAQSVPPFQLWATDEALTAQAGLTLFGEYLYGIQFPRWVEREMPKPGSRRGYMPMIGHLAEAGVVIHDDFRAGNIAPASDHLASFSRPANLTSPRTIGCRRCGPIPPASGRTVRKSAQTTQPHGVIAAGTFRQPRYAAKITLPAPKIRRTARAIAEIGMIMW